MLALVGAGLSNAEIACRLFLVEGTVKGHVSTMLTRLGVKNRVQAALVAYETRLSDLAGGAVSDSVATFTPDQPPGQPDTPPRQGRYMS